MAITVTVSKAKEMVASYLKAGLVPFIKGSPGIGKSWIIQELADKYNLQLIDLRLAQCDPTDLLGFPCINKETNKASYVPMSTFPLQGDPLPKGKSGWLLFLDEFNSADRSVQKGGYKLIHDRKMDQTPLHPKLAIVCAGNLDTDNAIVEELSTALQSRLCHIRVVSDLDSFIEFAINNDIDGRIISFVRFKPDCLNTFDPDSESEEDTYACERTWHYVDRLLKSGIDINSLDALPLISGTISEGVARMFVAHSKIYKDLPTVAQIIANPKTVAVPEDPGILWALTGSIAQHANKTNLADLMVYTERMAKEFQVVGIRELLVRHKELKSHAAISKWVTENQTDLL
jgi:hypothetical protein